MKFCVLFDHPIVDTGFDHILNGFAVEEGIRHLGQRREPFVLRKGFAGNVVHGLRLDRKPAGAEFRELFVREAQRLQLRLVEFRREAGTVLTNHPVLKQVVGVVGLFLDDLRRFFKGVLVAQFLRFLRELRDRGLMQTPDVAHGLEALGAQDFLGLRLRLREVFADVLQKHLFLRGAISVERIAVGLLQHIRQRIEAAQRTSGLLLFGGDEKAVKEGADFIAHLSVRDRRDSAVDALKPSRELPEHVSEGHRRGVPFREVGLVGAGELLVERALLFGGEFVEGVEVFHPEPLHRLLCEVYEALLPLGEVGALR